MFKRLFVTLTILSVLFFVWYFQSIQPVNRFDDSMVDFEIKPKSTLDQISNQLSSAKLIRSRIAFKITVIKLGIASKIQAGYFKLSPKMEAPEIAEALMHAYAKQVRVTLPEGLRNEEVNFILEKSFRDIKGSKYSSTEFATLAKDSEGKLFPDTYDFVPESTAKDVYDRLTSRFKDVTKNIATQDLPKILVLASLLEREAANSEEMPTIAGVLKNRLDAGWPLQVDATVQYALGKTRCKKLDCDWWKESLTLEDLRLNSPFNTYLHKGLPPQPISNPGRSAIEAAAAPQKTSAWFYLHDPKGQIHFANTIEEHNNNVCVYLKKDCK